VLFFLVANFCKVFFYIKVGPTTSAKDFIIFLPQKRRAKFFSFQNVK
jgi:hypothetical protein